MLYNIQQNNMNMHDFSGYEYSNMRNMQGYYSGYMQNMPAQVNSFDMQMLSQYCWCDVQQQMMPQNNNSIAALNTPKPTSTSDKALKIKNRRRKKELPALNEKLDAVIQQIKSGEIVGFKACPKSMKGMYRNKSGRRSHFIGVSKNSQNWQVLINLGDFKKYIGTYSTKEEAALVYDFYSIALNGYKANTNFSYDVSTVTDMIKNYYENDRTFVPIHFVNRVSN